MSLSQILEVAYDFEVPLPDGKLKSICFALHTQGLGNQGPLLLIVWTFEFVALAVIAVMSPGTQKDSRQWEFRIHSTVICTQLGL
ncbi:hypothetical protein Y1Q_0017836 [Alligator mississippiensis]|uniref:Uncharacterized protein n=1 Tax=Alligator mississippiensis TaxID=8496 RepID=A0A151PFU6_ALLMI|nr:hypothetical protein Y1Q_0017836 [Alligator mississippiensis]